MDRDTEKIQGRETASRPSNGYESETDDHRLCCIARGDDHFVVDLDGVPIRKCYQSSTTAVHERVGFADFNAR